MSAYAASHSPLASFGRKRCFCSSVPASLMPSDPSSCTAMISPLVAQTFESSSIDHEAISELSPMPPYSSSIEDAEEVVLAEHLDDVPRELAGLVDLGRAGRDALARERPDELADLALLVVQWVEGAHRQGF